MKGLIMLGEYLDEILGGIKTSDCRPYDTKVRGTICLIDSKKSSVVGLIDLVDTREITREEYVNWHKSGKWANATFLVDENKHYFEYLMENPRRFYDPIKIEKTSHSWMDIDDELIKNAKIEYTLF